MGGAHVTETVKLQIDARGIARITLHRPERHNAFDDDVISTLRRRFDAVAAHDHVRAVVLQAQGESFSAGADIAYMRRMAGYSEAQNRADALALAEMLQALKSLPVPTIAQVQGAAIGGGVGLVACCDVAIAADSAQFALSEVRLGLIPATIGPYVVAAIGERAALRYFTTGERFSAARAAELGLISETASAAALESRVEALLNDILKGGPCAVRAAKRLVRDISGRALNPDLLADTAQRIAALRVSPEGQEGLGAFLAKRPASWLETSA
jgi:methylglutaconyl-CoA hydratase